MPWNQQTPSGYFYELIFDFIVASSYLFSSNFMFIVFISICWFYPAFSKKFQYFVRKIDQCKDNQRKKVLLCNLIRFHVMVKEWVLLFGNTSNILWWYLIQNIFHLFSVGFWSRQIFIVRLFWFTLYHTWCFYHPMFSISIW